MDRAAAREAQPAIGSGKIAGEPRTASTEDRETHQKTAIERNGEQLTEQTMQEQTKAASTSTARAPLPLPQDGPLLAFSDVAAYLRITPAAVRRMIDGRMGRSTPDEIGARLRQWVVRLSAHRRYIKREPFLSWLKNSSTTT